MTKKTYFPIFFILILVGCDINSTDSKVDKENSLTATINNSLWNPATSSLTGSLMLTPESKENLHFSGSTENSLINIDGTDYLVGIALNISYDVDKARYNFNTDAKESFAWLALTNEKDEIMDMAEYKPVTDDTNYLSVDMRVIQGSQKVFSGNYSFKAAITRGSLELQNEKIFPDTLVITNGSFDFNSINPR